MKILLIGVAALTAVALLEALFYTLRFLSDRRRDELKRRLSNLGGASGGPALGGVLRMIATGRKHASSAVRASAG